MLGRAQGSISRIEQILDLPNVIRDYQKRLRTQIPGMEGMSVAKKVEVK
jgi:hypothetical protein